jgi:hypothetical protein
MNNLNISITSSMEDLRMDCVRKAAQGLLTASSTTKNQRNGGKNFRVKIFSETKKEFTRTGLSLDHQVLTRKGWKYFDQLCTDDTIATLEYVREATPSSHKCTNTKCSECGREVDSLRVVYVSAVHYKPVQRIKVNPMFQGAMVSLCGAHTNLLCTPDYPVFASQFQPHVVDEEELVPAPYTQWTAFQPITAKTACTSALKWYNTGVLVDQDEVQAAKENRTIPAFKFALPTSQVENEYRYVDLASWVVIVGFWIRGTYITIPDHPSAVIFEYSDSLYHALKTIEADYEVLEESSTRKMVRNKMNNKPVHDRMIWIQDSDVLHYLSTIYQSSICSSTQEGSDCYRVTQYNLAIPCATGPKSVNKSKSTDCKHSWPEWLIGLSHSYAKLLVDYICMLPQYSRVVQNKWKAIMFIAEHEQIASQFMQICMHAGVGCRVVRNHRSFYMCSVSLTRICVATQSGEGGLVNYEGPIFHLEVDAPAYLVRRNGRMTWVSSPSEEEDEESEDEEE